MTASTYRWTSTGLALAPDPDGPMRYVRETDYDRAVADAERSRQEASTLREALWKACGDDEETVNSYIASVSQEPTP
jgi:hypothetical protein